MKTLQERLRIKAGMISLGERITWGSDSAIMQEAADALTAIDAEVERLKRDATRYQWIIKHAWVDDDFFDNRFGFAIIGAGREVPIPGDVGAAIDAAITQEAKP